MNKQEFIAYLEGYRDATDDIDMFEDIIAKAKKLDLEFVYAPSFPVWPPTTWPDTVINVAEDIKNWSVKSNDDNSWAIVYSPHRQHSTV